MTDLTPETLAELRRLLDAWREATEARGFMLMPPMEYVTPAFDAVDALPALLNAAARLAEVEAERDALAEEVADMVPRDWHGLMTILADVYPETAFPTLPDNEARDAGQRIVSLLRRVDALAAKVDAVREMHFENPFLSGACNECDAWLPCETVRALDGTETDHG